MASSRHRAPERALLLGLEAGSSPNVRHLQQAQGFEGGVAGLADYDVVVDRDAEFGGGFLDLAGHLDVGLRWGRVAGGVVMHQVALGEQTYAGLR